jgi:Zn-dependent protease with chaperone function
MMIAPALAPDLRAARPGQQFLDALQTRIEPVRVPLTYQAALTVVACAMILLPLVYMALVALAGWGVVWYALNGWALLAGVGLKARIIAYITPLFAGATVVFFLIKPLLFRQHDDDGQVPLDPEDEPLLFEFVRRTALAVGAPVPREIYLDHRVNASASFRRGLLSLFSNDLVLTLGVPLVAGMTVSQVAGVLAHEFGHFGQRAGMRLTYVIYSVNAWFARVVYERDRFDEKLEESFKGEGGDRRIQVVAGSAAFCVWLSRTILKGLMIVGHALSASLARQMEFDADRYMVRLVGHRVHASVLRGLFTLSHVYRMSLNSVPKHHDEQILADSLAMTMRINQRHFSEPLESAYQEYLAQDRTHLFDTHPTTRERIAKGMEGPAEGAFASDLPAPVLFRDFTSLERAMSIEIYEMILYRKLPPEALVPAVEALAQQDAYEDTQAAERYIPRGASTLHPLPLPATLPPPPAHPEAALRQAIAAVEADRSAMAAGIEEYGTLFHVGTAAYRAEALLRLDLPFEPSNFGLEHADLGSAREVRRSVADRLEEMNRQLAPAKEATARRLTLALSLLARPEVAARLPEAAEWRGDVPQLLSALARFREILDPYMQVQEMHNLLDLLRGYDGKGLEARRLDEVTRRGHALLSEILKALDSTPDPLATAPASLARTSLPGGLPPADPDQVRQAIRNFLGGSFDVYTRILGRLCRMAEGVERVLTSSSSTR